MTQRLIPAVGYVRCSTDQQEDSPEQQKLEIQKFAELKGYEIVEWFVDFGKSGTTFDLRPEFQRLLRAVEQSPLFQAVICYDESRWGRAIDAEENTYWRVLFRRHGVDVQLVKTSIDPTHDFAPMLKAFEGVQASQYSKKLSELTLRGAKSNRKFSNGGTAPYGYRRLAINTKSGSSRILEDGDWCIPNQEKVAWTLGPNEELSVVRMIFDERIRGMAYVLVAEKLNHLGIPCPKRGRWRNTDQKWGGTTIKSILDNPAYYGARAYNRNSMSKILASAKGKKAGKNVRYPHWKNSKDQWIIEEGAHEPIVSKEIWDAANAQALRRPEPKSNQHTVKSDYLLSGLIRCSRCGFGFQGQATTAKGRPYHRYIDSGWQAKRVCEFFAIPKKEIEDFTVDAIAETFNDPVMLTKIEEAVESMMKNGIQRAVELSHSAHAQQSDLAKRKENLLQAISQTDNQVIVTDILRKMGELDGEIRRSEIQIQDAKTYEVRSSQLSSASQKVRAFMANFEEHFNNAPAFEKKVLIRKCVSKILVDRERKVARVYVRRLPDMDPRLTEGLITEAPTTDYSVVGAASSGGRT